MGFSRYKNETKFYTEVSRIQRTECLWLWTEIALIAISFIIIVIIIFELFFTQLYVAAVSQSVQSEC